MIDAALYGYSLRCRHVTVRAPSRASVRLAEAGAREEARIAVLIEPGEDSFGPARCVCGRESAERGVSVLAAAATHEIELSIGIVVREAVERRLLRRCDDESDAIV
jgi:hypothetical protein